MGKREEIKTTKKEIVEYWERHMDESEMSVDFAEAHERCWRCGCKRNLDRCHIVPASLGGEDVPSNFVLLCKRCHLDNPNVADPEIMKAQIKKSSFHFGDPHLNIATLAGILRMTLKEYDKRNGRKTEKHIKPYVHVREYI